MTIYTIKDYPHYRIVEKGREFYPEKFNTLMFFKWWGPIYVRSNGEFRESVTFNIDSARMIVQHEIEQNDIEGSKTID